MFGSFEGILLNYGYIGLFLASFLASTILPFGSEGILILLIYKKFNIPALVLIASVGNFLGACTSYYIGFKGRGLVEKYLRFNPDEIEKAEKKRLTFTAALSGGSTPQLVYSQLAGKFSKSVPRGTKVARGRGKSGLLCV